MNSEISESRKVIYYLGMILVVIGLIMFFSAFFALATITASPMTRLPAIPEPGSSQCSFNGQPVTCDSLRSGFPQPLSSAARPSAFDPITPIIGLVLSIVGGFMMNYGRLGPAGSGLILDPQQARRDVAPWSGALGGVVEDAIASSPTLDNALNYNDGEAETVVKVRCLSCHNLNPENAKFCSECGQQLA